MRASFAKGALLSGALAGGGLGVLGAAGAAWNRTTARAVAALRPDRPLAPGSGTFVATELRELPAPVVRYFGFALTAGQPLPRAARFVQAGAISLRPGRWWRFTATEHFSVFPPGFVWDARVRLAPGVWARVRDAYRAGEGVMQASIAGLLPVVNQGGTRELASAAQLRYLAEAVWLPTALLPSAGVHWDSLDETTARATLEDAGVSVSMEVGFGASGEITGISALRYRDVEGEPVLTRWSGEFRDYRRVQGMSVPGWSQVGWWIGNRWQPYWRGRSLESEYEFAG